MKHEHVKDVSVGILGLGALGTYFAVKLIERVVLPNLIVKNENQRSLLVQRGLFFQYKQMKKEIPFPRQNIILTEEYLESLQEKHFDVLIIATTLNTAKNFIHALRRKLDLLKSTTLVFLQNGRLDWILTPRDKKSFNILRGLAFFSVKHVDVGAIRLMTEGPLYVGFPYMEPPPKKLKTLQILQRSQINCHLKNKTEIIRYEYTKAAITATFNSLSVVTGEPIGKILALPLGKKVVAALFHDMKVLLQRKGYKFARIGKIDLNLLSNPFYERLPFYKGAAIYLLGRRFKNLRASSYYRHLRGTELEISYILEELLQDAKTVNYFPYHLAITKVLLEKIVKNKMQPSLNMLLHFQKPRVVKKEDENVVKEIPLLT